MDMDIKRKIKYTKLFQKFRYTQGIPKTKKVLFDNENKMLQYNDILQNIKIEIEPKKVFQHWIDQEIYPIQVYADIGNIPPDYSLILDYSIDELIQINSKRNDLVSMQNSKLLLEVRNYLERVISEMKKLNHTSKDFQMSLESFESMKTKKAYSLFDALQRILFWSSLFWQTGHKLVGLGRLDKLLNRFVLGNEESERLIKAFLLELHEYYEYKSATLLGDIGQIIVLGGLEKDSSYFFNNFTKIILKVISELKITDPKILLRVSKNMPREILDDTVKCLITACGSPLLSNDDVVIKRLIEFGYEEEDAFNYVTSACWEPLSYGNSLEQNNLDNINFAKVFCEAMKDKRICTCNCFDAVLDVYFKLLKNEVKNVCDRVLLTKWEPDPLFSLFISGCVKNGKTIENGGAKYNDYGILSVGIGNAVNSLLAVKQTVFEHHECDLKKLNKMFNDKRCEKKIVDIGKTTKKYFGHDEQVVIDLTNQIIECATNELEEFNTPFGGKIKFGLSSPSYLTQDNANIITLDGRKYGDAYDVHISSRDEVAYTELLSFASQLYYRGYSCNGNVVDFFVSPELIRKNLEKFKTLLKKAIEQGFFQLQMNIVSSQMLIEAREDPEKFPDLIVRVWGFSAYFKDLPKEYQDVLINRALVSEGNI